MEPILILTAGALASILSGVLMALGPTLLQLLREYKEHSSKYEINVRLMPPVLRILRADRKTHRRHIARSDAAVPVEPELRLSKHDMEELRKQFREELRREGRRTFWIGFLQGAVFFALGVVATLLIS